LGRISGTASGGAFGALRREDFGCGTVAEKPAQDGIGEDARTTALGGFLLAVLSFLALKLGLNAILHLDAIERFFLWFHIPITACGE
jgi:hypothetical protein